MKSAWNFLLWGHKVGSRSRLSWFLQRHASWPWPCCGTLETHFIPSLASVGRNKRLDKVLSRILCSSVIVYLSLTHLCYMPSFQWLPSEVLTWALRSSLPPSLASLLPDLP